MGISVINIGYLGMCVVSFVFSGISQSLIDVGALPFHTKGLDAGVNGWLGCL
jgi:hypothetical protein